MSVLGLGSEAGAAYRRADGSFANARLDAASLRRLAAAGGGRYAAITPADEDLLALGVLDLGQDDASLAQGKRGRAWQDEGYWLLPPLMLLALLAFRRRAALAMLALCIAWPGSQAQAAQWWQRSDQVDHARMAEAAQAYRSRDYAQAAQRYRDVDSADAHYNRGNAEAKAGRYPQAVAAYDEALKREPGMDDAIANKRAVEAAMKRKPSQSQGGSQSQQPQQSAQDGGKGQGSPTKPQQPSKSQQDAQQPTPPTPPEPADANAQQAADAAQRERMQRALQQQRPQPGQSDPQRRAEQARETPQQRERRLANEAWLRRVPDDPGGLLREKFRIEHERRLSQGAGRTMIGSAKAIASPGPAAGSVAAVVDR